MMNRVQRIADPTLFVLALVASLVGLVAIFDAGYPRSLAGGHGPLAHEFVMQAIFLPIAMLVAYAFGRIRPEIYKKVAGGVWLISLVSLFYVNTFGHSQNGAARWINFGPIAVQPSEFTKLATILFIAAVLADRKAWPAEIKRRKNFMDWMDTIAVPKLTRLIPAFGILISVLLIEKGKDLGTAAVVAAVAYAMFALGGVSRKTLVAGALIAGLGVGAMLVKEPYRMERITNHAQRWSKANVDDIGYQTVQSELGMATGGVTGVGIGNGRAKHILPATTTDFVSATVGEEFGLIGVLFVLTLVGAIVWRLMFQAQQAQNRFSMLLLNGVGIWFGLQACVNVMMANGFLPAIGIPLPFISSGGSSLIALWLAIGVCQSATLPVSDKEDNLASSRNGWRNRRSHLSRA